MSHADPAVADSMHWGHSDEAEQSLLGALLLDNLAFDRVCDVVSERDFYAAVHRNIFRAIARMIDAGRPADLITVSDRLMTEDAERFAKEGGAGYLASLAQASPGAVNARRYAEIVRERSIARQLYQAGMTITTSVAGSVGQDIGQLVDQAQSAVIALGEAQMPGRGDFIDTNRLMGQVLEFVDHQFHRDHADPLIGVTTGFKDLDCQTTGLQPGDLIIVAARPSMGKSALALNMAEAAARHVQKPAVVFNLEMGNRQTGLRLLAAKAGVNVQRLVTGRLNDDEWSRITKSIAVLHDLPMLFHEHAGLTVNDVRALSRRAMRERHGLSMIMVDYLQLMVTGSSDTNRANQLAEVSRGLKLLAKELHVPVVALSQLSRDVEKRVNKRPMMSDLRESGALEQDADVIVFIYRDEYYHPNKTEDRGIAEIIVAKQRNGPIGTVRLRFRADNTRFEDEFPAHGAPA
jgi:replicative DNA helicase